MANRNRRMTGISFNSPVVLGFAFLCFLALALNIATGGRANALVFSVYRSSLTNPLTYVRFIGHVFGHADWEHFFSNMTLFLVVGPLLEEKYGSRNLMIIIGVTALATGIFHFIFFPRVALLGASGVVFAMILLSSFTCLERGRIPMTLILVAAIYIGGQVYNAVVMTDDISNLTHIIGGIVGAVCGYLLN